MKNKVHHSTIHTWISELLQSNDTLRAYYVPGDQDHDNIAYYVPPSTEIVRCGESDGSILTIFYSVNNIRAFAVESGHNSRQIRTIEYADPEFFAILAKSVLRATREAVAS